MPLSPLVWTADTVRALPDDGKRYELVRSELLVTPAPRAWHQDIVGRLSYAPTTACTAGGSFKSYVSPADISWGSDTLVQPDVFVVPIEDARTQDWTRMRTLVLVAEVLSPSTAQQDREQKRRLYQEHGVATLWLVDADKRCVEVWTPDARFPTVETVRISWRPTAAAEPLVIELTELFAEL